MFFKNFAELSFGNMFIAEPKIVVTVMSVYNV